MHEEVGIGAFGRPIWVEVDAAALRHNLRLVRDTLPPGAKLYAALKANAYGFGLVGAARAFSQGGADGFSIADLSDAITLRLAGLESPILLYGGSFVDQTFAKAITQYRIQPTIHDEGTAASLAAHLSSPMPVFVKIDCGLERLGIPAEAAGAFVTSLVRDRGFCLGGIYTHLHVPSDTADIHAYVEWQTNRFRSVLEQLTANRIDVPVAVLDSTGTINIGVSSGLSGADPGHILYGLGSGGPEFTRLPIRDALVSIKTRLIQVRDVDRPGHCDNAPFAIQEGMKVGILPFGLRDGMASIFTGKVVVRGQCVPTLGRPSLEHTRIELTSVHDAAAGDEVVLVGVQGCSSIPTAAVLEHCRHSRVTDMLIAVPPSVPRVYLDNEIPGD